MIKKQVWIWKGIPSDFHEFFKEVFILWIGGALFFGVLIAFIIYLLMPLVINLIYI